MCAVPFDRIVPLFVAVDSTTLRAIKIVRILRVGRLVKLAETEGVELGSLDEAQVQQIHPSLAGWRVDAGSYLRSADRRVSKGGTGATAIAAQLEELKQRLARG